jgi:hypothetical protein
VDCVSPTAPYETQPTTGVTVHEFYTAKDFPVRGNDTDLDRKDLAFFIPIPLIGMVSFDDVTLTQGYNIVLNDMHGKPKRVAHFAHKKIKDSGGNFVFGWGDADESDFVRRQTWHYKTDAAEGSACRHLSRCSRAKARPKPTCRSGERRSSSSMRASTRGAHGPSDLS